MAARRSLKKKSAKRVTKAAGAKRGGGQPLNLKIVLQLPSDDNSPFREAVGILAQEPDYTFV